jgi:hypothetical protein
VIDLGKVKRGFAALDRVAETYPEVVGRGKTEPAEWVRILREAGMSDEKVTQQLAIRLSVELIARVDRYATHITGELAGLAEVTRSDVVRVVLDRGLAAIEREQAARDAEGGDRG